MFDVTLPTATTTNHATRELRHLTAALDEAQAQILGGDGERGTADLVDLLDRVLNEIPVAAHDAVLKACREHTLHQVLLEDPYTARAFHKPRGYAGDAVMLDYLYSGLVPPGTSPVGADVFRATTGCATARSVVARRNLLSCAIDRAAENRRRPNVLAVASGHLREAVGSNSLAAGGLGSFLALDQDAESLSVVERDYGSLGVRAVRESVGALLKRRVVFSELDLVYAAGLFDYLDDRTARALVEILFSTLLPGGRLLVANFTPRHQARAYMAWFMDWRLICRDEVGLASLTTGIATSDIAETQLFTDAPGNIAYLELVRR